MDAKTDEIRTQLTSFVKNQHHYSIVSATVTAINDDDTVAIVLADGNPVEDARLKSIVLNSLTKAIIVPAVGSQVLLASIENSGEYVVIAESEIQEIVSKINDANYSLTSDGFLIKKGNDTLLAALLNMIEAVQQIAIVFGNNPNYEKLTTATTQLKNILRSE